MQQCCRGDGMLALRSAFGLARRASGQLPRALGSIRALRSLSGAVQLPGQREALPTQHRSLSTTRALPRAAAVEAPTSSSGPASAGGPRAAPNAPTFQEAISRLQEYWAGVGCALWLPHNTEVRAVVCQISTHWAGRHWRGLHAGRSACPAASWAAWRHQRWRPSRRATPLARMRPPYAAFAVAASLWNPAPRGCLRNSATAAAVHSLPRRWVLAP